MKIDIKNPDLAQCMIARLRRELEETFFANLCFDEMCTALNLENEKLKQHNAQLIERTTSDREVIAELNRKVSENEPRRKKKKPEADGADPS